MKIHFDIFSIAGQLEPVVLEFPAIPRPGDIIHVPTKQLPAEWVNTVIQGLSPKYKELLDRDEDQLDLPNKVGFEVQESVFWEAADDGEGFYPLVDVEPELWVDEK